MTSVDDLVEQYHTALKRQAEANAKEAALNDSLKIVLSQQVVAAGDVAISKAEHIARSSTGYAKAALDLDGARLSAENARAEVEYLRTRFETWRTKTSFAKARLTNG